MHGPTLWVYIAAAPPQVVGCLAFLAWIARNRVDPTLDRLVSTALLLRKRGHDEASARLLGAATDTYGRKAVEFAMRGRP